MNIDAHTHFWKYSKDRGSQSIRNNKVLQQDYLPGTVEINFRRNGIDGCVAVESEPTEVETRFLCELAATNPVIKAVVGWIDLAAPDLEKKLEEFSQYASLRGFRYTPVGEPAPEALGGFAALKPHGYRLDLLAKKTSVSGVLRVIGAAAGTPIVIDHAGSPDVNQPPSEEWKAMIRDIAAEPFVFCKLSGLITGARPKSWNAGQFYPFFDTILEHFPTDRIMYGGDWPYLLPVGSYVQWKSLVDKYLEQLVPEEKAKVFGGTAVSFFRL